MTRNLTMRLVATGLALIWGGAADAAPKRDETVYQAVEANRAGALELLKNIVNIDSGSGDVAGGKRVEELLATQLKASGADIRYEPAEAPNLPPNLVAVFHGTGKAKILIIAHIDTVFGPGTVAKRPFRIEGNRAHGPGIGDEKAGVVNAVTTLKILHDLGFKNYATITLLLDDSEELGSPGSTQLIKTLAKQNDVEFNMEPGDPPDAITVWRKGGGDIFIQVKGRPAHAGMVPQNGRNAAVELVHQLSALEGCSRIPVTASRSTSFGDLIFDAAGNLYGTAFQGGAGYGVVYEVSPLSKGGWHERVLHSFYNTPAGNPVAGLVLDPAGNLYGTTMLGATQTSCGGGCGALFELTPVAGGYLDLQNNPRFRKRHRRIPPHGRSGSRFRQQSLWHN